MIVKMQEDIYSYENKVAGNFSARQLVCIAIALVIIFPVFIAIFWSTNSPDLAATVAFISGLPVFFCSIFKKDGQHLEKILMYKLKAKLKYTQKRKFVMSNLLEEIQTNQKEYESANEKLENEKQQKEKQDHKKRLTALAKKGHGSKQRPL